MGWRISELVTVALPEGGLDRTVAFVLSLYANNETGEGIRPSMETVARRALCHPESARRCVKNLVRLGWLREIRRGTGGAMGQAEYAFDLGRLQHSNPGAGVHGFNPSARAGQPQRPRRVIHQEPVLNRQCLYSRLARTDGRVRRNRP